MSATQAIEEQQAQRRHERRRLMQMVITHESNRANPDRQVLAAARRCLATIDSKPTEKPKWLRQATF